MAHKMLVQIFVCLILVFVVLIAQNSKVGIVQRFAESFIEHMSVDYSVEDMKTSFKDATDTLEALSNKSVDAIDVMTGKPVYGEPIDKTYAGNETPVYAVGGGKVMAVGENEEIGKYIRILHGNQAESLYGNLDAVNVSPPENVKKGQIIGIYDKSKEKKFYYSFQEF